MYGVVHVCGIDGYSGKIVIHALMSIKNNQVIYEHVYRYVYNWLIFLNKIY